MGRVGGDVRDPGRVSDYGDVRRQPVDRGRAARLRERARRDPHEEPGDRKDRDKHDHEQHAHGSLDDAHGLLLGLDGDGPAGR